MRTYTCSIQYIKYLFVLLDAFGSSHLGQSELYIEQSNFFYLLNNEISVIVVRIDSLSVYWIHIEKETIRLKYKQ